MGYEARHQCVRALVDEHYATLVSWLSSRVGRELAEDIAQDVFVRLLRMEDIKGKPICVGYLLKIADNMSKRHYRKTRRHGEVAQEASRGSDDRVEDGAPRLGLGEFLREGLAQLPKREAEAIRLIVCNGLSYEQAAAAMDVRVSTINNWKHRGINRLKQAAATPRLRAAV